MVQVKDAIRKSVVAVASAVGLILTMSGCELGNALAHEDAVAREVTERSGSGARNGAAAATDPGGQDWTSSQISFDGCDVEDITLTGIRVGRHDSYDRVVFDLSGEGTPCYRVAYDSQPLQDGSGLPVDLGNHGAIRVEISGLGPEFPTIPPAYKTTLDGPTVAYALFDTFFEGVATSFIAVPPGATPSFAVDVLPGKVIVDVRH